MPFAAIWMGPEIIILSEVSQRLIPHDITCTWKREPMKQNHAKETKLAIAKVERVGGGVE